MRKNIIATEGIFSMLVLMIATYNKDWTIKAHKKFLKDKEDLIKNSKEII